ncbi:hypothetical protein AKJ43_02095 [candidate division MSBL1 archaeon SCGC-AAA261D19]|uniref:ATP-grasp domain-containing protein n=1 Tax=candidate division MSBL1 archaeon SCGC-AAA261D19 TaxID=1698273 RepID=A0A133V763_9EURY|nr:hypothetical protein AKJ43_02095 [candidate division MSBL1 archaeon SCGC-AAA261D19]
MSVCSELLVRRLQTEGKILNLRSATKRRGCLLRILIYEYAVSEGLAGRTVSPGILSEGFGMLSSIASDFRKAEHQVATIVDRQLMRFNPTLHADLIVPIESLGESRDTLGELSKSVDAVLAIAPETEEKLKNIVKLLEKGNAKSLNSTSESIGKISDKIKIHRTMEKNDLPVADWIRIEENGDEREIEEIGRELGYPLVIKQAESVGCDGVSILEDESQILQASKEIRKSGVGGFLAQRYIHGVAASAIVMSSPKGSTPLTLNLQRIKLEPSGSRSRYIGGAVPIHHSIENEALKVAESAIETIEGLRGLVGVDLVLSEGGPVIMEINPRLTTSYIGVSNVARYNPAQLMLDGILKEKTPKSLKTSGCAFFSKIFHRDLTQETVQRLFTADEVISPPFPVSYHDKHCSLALTKGQNLEIARQKFNSFKKSFQLL